MRPMNVRSMVRTLLAVGASATLFACSEGPTPKVSRVPDPPARSAPLDAGRAAVAVEKPIAVPVVTPDVGKKIETPIAKPVVAKEPKTARDHIKVARDMLAKKDWKGARKHAEAAIALAPDSSSAWNTMGRVELAFADKDAAIAAFEKAIEKNTDNAFAWNNLGLVLLESGRTEEAVTALEQATASKNPEAYMWNNLGLGYERLDRLVEARAAYQHAAKRGSDSAKVALARLEKKKGKSQATGPDVEPAKVDKVDKVDKIDKIDTNEPTLDLHTPSDLDRDEE